MMTSVHHIPPFEGGVRELENTPRNLGLTIYFSCILLGNRKLVV